MLVIVTDCDRGVQARWTPETVQIVRRERLAVDVLKARARVFIKVEPEIEVGNWHTLVILFIKNINNHYISIILFYLLGESGQSHKYMYIYIVVFERKTYMLLTGGYFT